VQETIRKGRAALAKYGTYLRTRSLSRHVRLVLYKQYVRPVLEYGTEVWWPTNTESAQLERMQLQAARAVLGCFDRTPGVAVRAELGLEELSVRRRRARLWWYSSLRDMMTERLPAQVYSASTSSHLQQGHARS